MKSLLRDRQIWTHSQTLDKHGRWWRHGRAWLNWGVRKLCVEWSLRTDSHFGVSFSWKHMDALWSISVEVPLLFWYLSYNNGRCWYDQERGLSLRWFLSGFHWRVWAPIDSWNRQTPRWRDGSWYPLDTLLGRSRYHEEPIGDGEIHVEMPEGVYVGTYTKYAVRRKRPRWPVVKRQTRFEVRFPDPIPEPGKGENSWDIEDTATYEVSMFADDPAEVASRIRYHIQRVRKWYGGDGWVPSDEEAGASR